MYKLKIEMIHDVVCSWCAIGYLHLKQALEELEDVIEADLHFLPFELNPTLGQEGIEIVTHLGNRMGWSESQVMAYREDLIPKGLKAGVTFDFEKRTHYYNSFETHCLMHWAEKQGKQVELNEVLLHAYHSQGANLSDRQTLLNLAVGAGLKREATEAAMASGELIAPVKDKLNRVATYGIKSVPAFLFDTDTFVSGSNSVEFFREFLQDMARQHSTPGKAA